ncbi:MAG: type IV secretory system conjugative DNA transfer family protein [Pseudomonadota bacterium]
MIDPSVDRFGSAGFADARMRRDAGLRTPQGAYIGHDPAGRAHYSSQQSALLLVGGARSLKGSVVIPSLVDGCLYDENGPHHLVLLDFKGQDGPIAAQQVRHGRHCYYFNPRKSRSEPSHRFDALGHLHASSPTLVSDAMDFGANWNPETDPRSSYFERTAGKINAALAVTYARTIGPVTLPAMADKIAQLGDRTEEWLSFQFDLTQQPEAQIREVATLLERVQSGDFQGGGWDGIKGELAKSYACLVDHDLRDALSPPFDFSFDQLTENDTGPCMVSIMEDLQYAETSGPIIRTLFSTALLHKRRQIANRPQYWLLQEIGNIGAWPLAESLATIGAGYGIRPAYVVQSTEQLENLKKGASKIIPNSCGTQIFLGTRSASQARLIQSQLGRMSVSYTDPESIERANAAKSRAIAQMLLGQGDPMMAMLEAGHQERMALQTRKMGRDLRGIDEILGERNGQAFVFLPGVLEKPAYLTIRPYWQRFDLRGAYLGDPFHNKPGTVEIRGRFRQRIARVVTEDAPSSVRDWPQYRDTGQWRYVKGFRP